MILGYLRVPWAAVAVGLGNHLWQSTLFLAVAGLLTLSLRKNRARTRYWLWLAASVKFLAPFSLLVGVGSHLGWWRGSAGAKAGLYFAMEEVSEPFTQPTVAVISRSAHAPGFTSWIHLLPAVLVAVWLCGVVVVLSVWAARWRRVSAMAREAVPLREGREAETLRRLERLGVGGMRAPIELVASRTPLEPGVFGIVRPVLVWPEGISELLDDAHLEAILAHELWHVRRRDNLAAAIHMLVEAILWFHPAVWWLGARLVEERERACDEEVLELGSDRQVYAESILKICEFCVGSPLACISGVTGADLKKRMVRIMSEGVACKLDFSKKLLLSAAGVLAVAVPVVFGILNVPQSRAQSPVADWQAAAASKMSFNVASVKQNKGGTRPNATPPLDDGSDYYPTGGRLSVTDFPLFAYIGFAYKLTPSQMSSLPSQLPRWATTELFDIEAQAGGNVTKDQMRLMMQSLLADRFKLVVHSESREGPVFAMVLVNPGKTGPQLRPYVDDPPCATGVTLPRLDYPPPDKISVGEFPPNCFALMVAQRVPGRTIVGSRNVSMQQIANDLPAIDQTVVDRPVVDETGLSGNFDFMIETGNGESLGPTLMRTLRDQLGVKLESTKGSVNTLVIDHVEAPAAR